MWQHDQHARSSEAGGVFGRHLRDVAAMAGAGGFQHVGPEGASGQDSRRHARLAQFCCWREGDRQRKARYHHRAGEGSWGIHFDAPHRTRGCLVRGRHLAGRPCRDLAESQSISVSPECLCPELLWPDASEGRSGVQGTRRWCDQGDDGFRRIYENLRQVVYLANPAEWAESLAPDERRDEGARCVAERGANSLIAVGPRARKGVMLGVLFERGFDGRLYGQYLLSGLGWTLALAFFGWWIAFAIGTVVGVGRTASK